MVSLCHRVETGHRDVIHDAEMNHAGTRLATCSSDQLVKIFEVREDGQSYPIVELVGHDAPVWQVTWSHPLMNRIEYLASCSHDKKVNIWREIDAKYQRVYMYNEHEASINSVCWAPIAYGIAFACCSTDCTISVVQCHDDVWMPVKIYKAHDQGVNAVSWAPAQASPSLIDAPGSILPKRLASGGNDKLVKVWREEVSDKWTLEVELELHEDWVRDVAWAPAQTHGCYTIASCGLDGLVVVWRTDNLESKVWKSNIIAKFDAPVQNVSWSPNGTVLAVSAADNQVSLFQERIQNEWVVISDQSNASTA